MTKQDYNYIMAYKNRPYARYFNYYFKSISADKVRAYDDIARRSDVCTTPDVVSCNRFYFTTVYTSDRGEFVIDTVSYTHRYTLNDLAKYEKRLKRQYEKKLKQTSEQIEAAKISILSEALDNINENHPEAVEYLLPDIFNFIDKCFQEPLINYVNYVDFWVNLYTKNLNLLISDLINEAAEAFNAERDSWTQYMDAIL